MFGLTKREQQWAAEQKAAEVLAKLLTDILKIEAAKEKQKLEFELRTLKDDNARLRAALKEHYNQQAALGDK